MKVKYKKILFGDFAAVIEKDKVQSVSIGKIDFCCSVSRDHGERFSMHFYPIGTFVQGVRQTNETIYLDLDYFEFDSAMGQSGISEIKFCPWCGAKIELVEVKVVAF